MNNLGHSLSLFFGGRRKIEAESKRLTEEHKKRKEERQRLEATLRHAASQDCNLERVEELIKQGVNVDAQDPETGRTALIMTVDYSCRTTLTFLLSHGADIHIQANNGKSAVDIARDKGQMDIVRLLEEAHRSNQDYHPR